MRFDLEFNITEQLTQDGLDLLADTVYGKEETPNIVNPAQWDNLSPLYSIDRNVGAIDTSRFKGLDLPSWLYTSGVAGQSDILIDKIVVRNNLICPIFIAGGIYSYKHRYEWSDNVISKYFDLDGNNEYYADIDEDMDNDSVSIYTMKLEYPGFLVKEKIFKFTEYDGVSLKTTFSADKQSEYMWTRVDNKIYLNKSRISYNGEYLGAVPAEKTSMFSLPEFPILGNDDASSISLGPLFSAEDIRIFTSIIQVRSTNLSETPVEISYSVTPILTYRQTTRSVQDDIVWKNINLTPSAISFSDGLLCLYNVFGTAGGTIRTSDGGTILMPLKVEIEKSADYLRILDSVKITATCLGIDDIPVKGANIRFELTSSNADAVWLENNTNSFTAKTGLDGKIDANIIINSMKFGHYIQKEWVKNVDGKGEIRIPYVLPVDSDDPVYLYFVTADDPILGKKNATQYLKYNVIDQWQRLRAGEVENPIEEYYTQKGNIRSYTMNGRKIAWVRLTTASGETNKLKSAYIKPESIETGRALATTIRDLFLKDSTETILTDPTTITDISLGSANKYGVTGYIPGVLPEDGFMTIVNGSTNAGTLLRYSEPVPAHDDIVGYWLVTGVNGTLDVQAYFEDDENNLYIESNLEQIEIQNYIKAESEFILSDIELENYNTALNGFSYYTVSEYINNPFHINACTYGCKYSNPMFGECKHPNRGIRVHYLEGEGNFCLHTPESDDGKGWNDICPIHSKYMKDAAGTIILDEDGLDKLNPKYEIGAASFINPFVLHIDKNS